MPPTVAAIHRRIGSFFRQPRLHTPEVQAITDFGAILLSALVSYLLISQVAAIAGFTYENSGKIIIERVPVFVPVVMALIGWFFLSGQYHQRIAFWASAKDVVLGSLFALMAEGFGLFANKADASRLWTFSTWLLVPVILMLVRMAVRKVSHARGEGLANVLVVGSDKFARDAARLVQSDPHLGFKVCGTVEPSSIEGVLSAIEAAHGVNYVVVALSGSDAIENDIVMALRERGISLIIVPVPTGLTSGMEVQYLLGEESVFLVDRIEVVPRLTRACKRAFDVIVAGAILALAAVPMTVVACLIKRDGGPALFAHKRVGLDGESFGCLKFRSMSINAEALLEQYLCDNDEARLEWETSRKLKDDPRVTSFGRFIRKTALDELPQLINVIRGDMALVGPRPVTQSELDYYGSTVKLYSSVRPGITGLWQVSGRSDLSYDHRVRLDTWYVRNWTPWHDIAILLKTIPAVLSRRGAY
jgi:Undecaprenyl-phosphate galactose phosphotransferase WbaP